MEIKYNLPGLYEHYQLNIGIGFLLQEHPEYFYDNIKINSFYGNFQFCTWDGGRVFEKYTYASKEFIEKLKMIYNDDLNIGMRFVFTNNQIEEKDCFDRYNNLILSICEDDLNEIVIASPILEKYIKNNYPKYSFISSTTKCILNLDDLKKEFLNENYKLICLDYNLNKNFNFLNNLTQEEKDKTEFLVNAICPPACPNRKNHYYLNSLFSSSFGKNYTMADCLIYNEILIHKSNNNLQPNDILEYIDNGFSNFKIEGRSHDSFTMLIEFVKYLIKPEYQLEIVYFLNDFINNFNIEDYSYSNIKSHFRNIIL